ncbi:SigE family RNA polymerase sigma factor [Streptomyces coacervatus]|uniref:SigE family RNA polymerase sigma factor n=1 Tax=Streptomyces coacervatus TaxID=647381 RepID=A0ABP7I979_9ACTN|nr:SigE family RNA polymerase sigma factor [Streptomyces coacervatus]MDF2272771.1 SigE family RNA polymerase sigma factor [Streptomyces coacervatus]
MSLEGAGADALGWGRTEGGGAHTPRTAGGEAAEEQGIGSFAVLYRAERLTMVRLAAFLVDDPHVAEDVVQDAFTGLHAHWHRLRDQEAAVHYLRRAVVNKARSVLRRRRTARGYVWPTATPEPGADQGALMAEEHRRIRRALTGLPRRQREVLVLRYWSDLSEAQIAATLGISAGTVKSTASRGLKALEAALLRSST